MLALIAYLVLSNSNLIQAQEVFKIEETLPPFEPRVEKSRVYLPYKNESSHKVTLVAHSLSCGCAKIMGFPKLDVAANETIRIPIEFSTQGRQGSPVSFTLSISGTNQGDFQPSPLRLLAEYRIKIPVLEAVSIVGSDAFQVSNGKSSELLVINNSGFHWDRIQVQSLNDDIGLNVRLHTVPQYGREVQGASIVIANPTALSSGSLETESALKIQILAAPKGVETLIHLAEIEARVKVLSSIVVFPKTVNAFQAEEFVTINVVGRALQLDAIQDSFTLMLDDRILSLDNDYSIQVLSPKWIRFKVRRESISQFKEHRQLTFMSKALNWRSSIGIDSLKE